MTAKHRVVLMAGIALVLLGPAILILAGVVTFLLPESYAATAMIKVGLPTETTIAGVTNATIADRFLQTEAEVIRSETILSVVASRLELPADWGGRYAGGAQLKVTECVRILQATVESRPHPGANILDVTAYSQSPQEAANLANAIADVYMEHAAEHPTTATPLLLLQRATPIHKPVKPNKPLNILLGALVGLPVTLLGIALVLIASWQRTLPPPTQC